MDHRPSREDGAPEAVLCYNSPRNAATSRRRAVSSAYSRQQFYEIRRAFNCTAPTP